MVSWPDVFSSCISIEDFYSKFLSVINLAIENFVPMKKKKFSINKYPKNILIEQAKKKKLWQKRKKLPSEVNKLYYKNQARCS